MSGNSPFRSINNGNSCRVLQVDIDFFGSVADSHFRLATNRYCSQDAAHTDINHRDAPLPAFIT